MKAATTTVAPATVTKLNVEIKTAVSTLLKREGEAEVALDNVRSVSKSMTTKNGWTKEQLTAQLLEAGLQPARASEIAGFVFPRHNAARVHLDAALAANAKQTDLKKRIAKPVILALQRDKDGTLTLEKALADHKAKSLLGAERKPGGQTSQTTSTATKAKTPAQIEEELKSLIKAAMEFAKANQYDGADFAAVAETVEEEFTWEEDEAEAEAEAQD